MRLLPGLKRREGDHTADPDVALMQRAAAGDKEAFVRLYEKHRDRIYNFTRRLLGDPAQAEEATQETFLKLYQSRTRYTPQSRFSTFLYRVAKNHCLNMLQRVEHGLTDRSQDAAVRADASPSPEGETETRRLRAQLNAALASLPTTQRTAFVLCHFDGLSQEEAAQVLDVSESAIKSLIFRARQALIEFLHADLEGQVSHEVR